MCSNYYEKGENQSTNFASISDTFRSKKMASAEKTLSRSGNKRSIKNINKFINGSSNSSIKSNHNQIITQKSFRLIRCLLIKNKQRKYFLSHAINRLKLLIVPKSAVSYKLIYNVEELEKNKMKTTVNTLCKGLNAICNYKMKRMLEYFQLWQIYTYYVNHLKPITLEPQNNLEIEPLMEDKISKETLKMEFTQIREISGGFRLIESLFNKRKWKGLHEIEVHSISNIDKETYYKKWIAISVMVKYLRRPMKSYFMTWKASNHVQQHNDAFLMKVIFEKS